MSEGPCLERKWPADVVFWCAAAALLFVGLGSTSLWAAEDRWAEVTREMFLTGQFFHPTLNGQPYFDKPLFTYWAIALVKVLTGRLDEWTVRIPSAVSGLVALWATRRLGRALWSERTGRLAGWILLSSYGFVFWSRTAMADMENVAAIMLALLWYWTRRDRPGLVTYLVFYAILSIGAQMKGLAAVAAPVIALAPELLREGRWRRHLRPSHFLAAGVGLLIYLAPFLYGAVTAGNYTSSGLTLAFKENVLRYFHPFDHVEPFYVYLLYLPLLLLPWAPLLLVAVVRAVRPVRWRELDPRTKWLYAAAALVFLFFTASGSRRSYYILPMLPLCALMAAIFLRAQGGERWKRAALSLQAASGIILAAGGLAGAVAWPFARRYLPAPVPLSLVASAVVVGSAVLLLWLFRRRLVAFIERWTGMRPEVSPYVLTAVILFGGFFCWQKVSLDEFRGLRPFGRELAAERLPAREIAFYPVASDALTFYLGADGPHPVLTRPEEVPAYFRQGGKLLVLKRKDLDGLLRSLPAGTSGEALYVEQVSPWEARRRARDHYVAWRMGAH